ncbi:hypothetical protein EK21DRAFT_90293 [Setomelanomma holmii]|uniref:Uncharacterized protein n=1 Tax=Setomelanomma holmii TaxID=210430 RepID=A0A9P4H690_9PLEO|nr:hypothetical protein EK21DRAFT_90293 [Setomelanomma holmii]
MANILEPENAPAKPSTLTRSTVAPLISDLFPQSTQSPTIPQPSQLIHQSRMPRGPPLDRNRADRSRSRSRSPSLSSRRAGRRGSSPSQVNPRSRAPVYREREEEDREQWLIKAEYRRDGRKTPP